LGLWGEFIEGFFEERGGARPIGGLGGEATEEEGDVGIFGVELASGGGEGEGGGGIFGEIWGERMEEGSEVEEGGRGSGVDVEGGLGGLEGEERLVGEMVEVTEAEEDEEILGVRLGVREEGLDDGGDIGGLGALVGEGGGEEIEEGFGVGPGGEGEGGIEGIGEGDAGAVFEADGGEGEGEMVLDFGVGGEIGGGFFEEGEGFGVIVFEEEDPGEGIGD